MPEINKHEIQSAEIQEVMYGIPGKEFAKAYWSAPEKTKNSTEYLRSMAPVFSTISEFSNPVIMKVYLK